MRRALQVAPTSTAGAGAQAELPLLRAVHTHTHIYIYIGARRLRTPIRGKAVASGAAGRLRWGVGGSDEEDKVHEDAEAEGEGEDAAEEAAVLTLE